MDWAKTYSKLRASVGFLVGLIAFIVVWLAASAILHFDKDHGLINLILSSEASVSLAFFAMLQEKTDARVKAQMDIMQEILIRMDKRDEKIMEVVEDIHEEVEDGH